MLALVGCQEGVKPSPSEAVGPAQTLTITPVQSLATPQRSATPTPQPLKATICLGHEPPSLFPFSLNNLAGRTLSAALFPGSSGPSNLNNSILDSFPDSDAGTLLLQPLEVLPGEPIVDASGELNVLAADVLYRPVGCQSIECAQAFTGAQPVQMDQWVLRFHLRPGLKWSDGEPLTSSDSLYAFELAKSQKPYYLVDLLDHTAVYQALDEQTLEWRGLPGYTSAEVASKFFAPLPRHAWEGLDQTTIAQAEIVARKPISYGPFMIASWTSGERIQLVRNPNYFRAAEGLPYLDELDFMFVTAGDAAEQSLVADNGGCDVLDASAILEEQVAQYAAMQAENKVKLIVQPAAWEALYLNIVPIDPKQTAFFSQAAVRQAATLCIDRAEIARQVFGGLAVPAASLSAAQPSETTFDASQGQALLEQAGWRDLDQNPNTPRTALSVPGVPDGTLLSFTYLVSDEPDRQLAAKLISQGLNACGMAVEISFRPPADYLAPGPDGPVFGRTFTAAQFAWSVPEGVVPCDLFTSASIPGPYPQSQQEWGGANASGYSNLEFDKACLAARTGFPGAEQAAAWAQIEQIFSKDLPAIPLYWRPALYVLRPQVCGFTTGSAENWPSFNPESLNVGIACQSRD